MFEHGFVGMSHWGSWLLVALLIAVGSAGTLLHLRMKKKTFQNTDRIDSMEILKSRLARGDITVDEFNVLKASL